MRRLYVISFIVLLLGACIKNDFPSPVIYGNVKKIEVSGQQKSVINTKNRTIELELSDTVDLQHVRLLQLEISADPARPQNVLIEPQTDLEVNALLDLTKSFHFKITTYQTYEWTIMAKQPIERYFQIENQIGDAIINEQEKMVTVYVPQEQDLSDINILDIKLGGSLAAYSPDPSELRNFIKPQIIKVSCFGHTEEWKINVFHINNEGNITGKVNAWAKFAYVEGMVPSNAEGTPRFEYKLSNASTWKPIECGEVVNRKFSAKLTGLRPKTKYVVRGVVGKQIGDEVEFTTEAAEQIAYSNFDNWYTKNIAGNQKAWCMGVEGIQVWDTGNEGGASFGFNPSMPENNDVIQGTAACLTSCWAAVKFAAGSIYTGKFNGLDGFNAKLDFGIPYECRPTTLSGYYKYISQPVNRIPNDRFKFLENTNDSCHIYVALCDWNEAFHANTKTETLVDYSKNNPSIIAYGELKTDRKMSEYEKFTIDITYRNTTKKPKYIVIVATSSKYGDYFAGSDTSVLYLDEFQLGFD